METIDQEVTDAAIDFLKRAKQENKPFFLWWNSTRMHIWTRLKSEQKSKQDERYRGRQNEQLPVQRFSRPPG